ncbi:MAG: glycosyltransferase family 4 protein [Actinobacteria bacterium]|nr:glycosyltransferase family 4 protein [Actinomycetota bacterium]
MIHIAICTPELAYGDAVSNDVFGMFKVLSSCDFKVKIFAENIFVTEPEVEHIDNIRDYIKGIDDILIYHFSIGWHKGLEYLTDLNCKKIIKYHNITPPDFFYGFSNDHVVLCKAGREHLSIIAKMNSDLYLNDSDFNMREMISSGAEVSKNFVIPPFNNVERLMEIKPNFNILDRYNDGKTNILTVGRISPNKGLADLIDAFEIYNRYYNPDSRLIIVGDNKNSRLYTYIRYLYHKLVYLNLEDKVIFTGKVSDEDLKTYFLTSKVFTSASHHEGFSVPLIEAMSMKIPIAAYGGPGAVRDTIGEAGLVWEEPDIDLISASVDEIVSNEDAYFYLGEIGWKRYKDHFTNQKIKENFLEIINKLL